MKAFWVAGSALTTVSLLLSAPADAAQRRSHPLIPATRAVTAGRAGPFDAPSTLAFEAPDFARIKDGDYEPAIMRGIAIKRAEIRRIATNPAAPTFANTMEAWDRAGLMLRRVSNTFDGVKAANTNPVLDKVDETTQPLRTALDDEILQDPALFARVKTLFDKRASLGLAPDQMRLLTVRYNEMVHAGALLKPADKARVKAINARLSTLTTAFGQKLTAGTKDAAPVFHDKAALAGLSDGEIAAAAKDASARGLPAGSYVLALQNTTQQPLLPSLTNRATRQALFDASWTRTEKGDANDTRAMVVEIGKLRTEKAHLLGYKTFADYALYDQMAHNSAAAEKFLTDMVPAVTAEQKKEIADLDGEIRAEGGNFDVTPADWAFYADRLARKRLDFDSDAVKPYFEIGRVQRDGVFYAANQLYGLTFKPRSDIPVYNPDVSVFEVFDADGKSLALFYFDPWKRDNKQGGAWMSNFVDQSTTLGTKPVIYNVANFTKPAAGQPALISWDDVITMFHEFGHALHGMMSNQRYLKVSGTDTARDFVEFPSQFNENWARDPKVFAHFAKHWQTGADMPADLATKMLKAASGDQGYGFGEVVTAQLLDQNFHSSAVPVTDVDAFEAQTLGATGLQVKAVPSRYRLSYFRHIFSNEYAASYYAYAWSEMLDHDAYQWFVDHGGLTRANGDRFRKMVLSRGNSEDLGTIYRDFTGRNPDVTPMLRFHGLVAGK